MEITNADSFRKLENLAASDELAEWQTWWQRVRDAQIEFEQLKDQYAAQLIEGVEWESLPESDQTSIHRLLELMWATRSYGSVGSGIVGRTTLFEERRDFFLKRTGVILESAAQFQLMEAEGLPLEDRLGQVQEAYENLEVQIDGRGDLRASKARAFSVAFQLAFPSIFSVRIFQDLLRILGLDIRQYPFPMAGALLIPLLAEYLPEENRSDPHWRYIFPWIAYDYLSRKRYSWLNWSDELLAGRRADNIPPDFIDIPDAGVGEQGINSADRMLLSVGQSNAVVFVMRIMEVAQVSRGNQRYHRVFLDRQQRYLLSEDKLNQLLEETGASINSEYFGLQALDEPVFNQLVEGLRNSVQQSIENIEQILEAERVFANAAFRQNANKEPVIGAREIAGVLALVLRRLEAQSGMMVGIFGPWGRGKTFLFEQTWKNLNPAFLPNGTAFHPFHLVPFHAWKYQDTEAAWGYMYQSIAEAYYNTASNPVSKLWRVISLNFTRRRFSPFYALATALVLALGLVFKDDFGNTFKETMAGLVGGGALLSALTWLHWFQKKHSKEIKSIFNQYGHKHSYEKLLGTQSEIQGELRTLVTHWLPKDPPGKRILLFVDDLDRCREDRIIPMIDSLRVMLDDEEIAKRVVVVAAVDERILRESIRKKYEHVKAPDLKSRLEREYLDKLFVTGLKLGPLTAENRREIFRAYAESDVEIPEPIVLQAPPPTPVPSTPSPDGENEQQHQPPPVEPVTEDVIMDDEGDMDEQPSVEASDKLSPDEYEKLMEAIAKLKDTTPRQIRIFYYRYLLAQQLRVALGNSLVGLSQLNSDNLIRYLLYLTENHQSATEFAVALTDELKMAKMPYAVLSSWRSMDEEGRKACMAILDLVVAY